MRAPVEPEIVRGAEAEAAYAGRLASSRPQYGRRGRPIPSAVDPRAFAVPATPEVGPGHGAPLLSAPAASAPVATAGPVLAQADVARPAPRRPAQQVVAFGFGALRVKVPVVGVSAGDGQSVVVLWFACPESDLPVEVAPGPTLDMYIDGAITHCVYSGAYVNAGAPGDSWAMIFVRVDAPAG